MLRPASNPPGSLQDDLRFLERWVWAGGMLGVFMLLATIVMAVLSLGRRDWSTANLPPRYAVDNVLVALQYATTGLAFAVHAVLLIAAGRGFARGRDGGSLAGPFRMLRWTIIVSPILSVIVGALLFIPLWFL